MNRGNYHPLYAQIAAVDVVIGYGSLALPQKANANSQQLFHTLIEPQLPPHPLAGSGS
jgi:hypothetical protein